jgi:hypothetical protein
MVVIFGRLAAFRLAAAGVSTVACRLAWYTSIHLGTPFLIFWALDGGCHPRTPKLCTPVCGQKLYHYFTIIYPISRRRRPPGQDARLTRRQDACVTREPYFTFALPNFASAPDRRARMPGSPAGRMPALLGNHTLPFLYLCFTQFHPGAGANRCSDERPIKLHHKLHQDLKKP